MLGDVGIQKVATKISDKLINTNKRCDDRCPSLQHLDAEGAQAWAHYVYDQIQQGKREMPIFPWAS
jgi:hypothetical protein